MQPRINFFILICLLSFATLLFAQETADTASPEVTAIEPNEVEVYVAEIVGDEVNIRSGPGTNYYVCSKLNKGDRIKIVGSQFSWSRIEPPVGSFSWISKQYVSLDPGNPEVGTVTGGAVRVYAGSESKKPIHSVTQQGRLDEGNRVKLLGEEQDEYYKIAPPSFAYLWVSTQYTKPLGLVGEVQLEVEPKIDITEPVPMTDKLREFYVLQEKIKQEQTKPIPQQDYSRIKQALLGIANNEEAEKAAKYAEFTLKQIERFELALEIDQTVKLQNELLQQTKERIARARAEKLAQIRDLGKFVAIGKLQISSIYGEEYQLKHYQLIDDRGQIVCFALPANSSLETGLKGLLRKNVGLIGKVTPHPQTASVLVKFTEIVEIE